MHQAPGFLSLRMGRMLLTYYVIRGAKPQPQSPSHPVLSGVLSEPSLGLEGIPLRILGPVENPARGLMDKPRAEDRTGVRIGPLG
jgi:hypothetical protein